MKKITISLIAITILAVSAYGAVLMSSSISGNNVYCYYSDGSVSVIDGMGVCPATN